VKFALGFAAGIIFTLVAIVFVAQQIESADHALISY
jgi:heme/copper-type cytochrome/quinol oxidase subunit 4